MNISAQPSDKISIDPITLSVIQNHLQQICSEMDLVHEKASFSPVISEGYDRSNGIYDLRGGDVIAQGENGLPIFIGVMQATARALLKVRQDFEEGDVFMVNDPYLGGTHLMDVKMVRPFFYKGQPWCLLANTGHWPDTGGSVPGGFTSRSTEIHQEGLIIPPVKLFRKGVMDQDILNLVLSNIRVPDERVGDIRAQIGALSVGERRLTQLLDRYGADTVQAAINELYDRSDRQMRACIETVPDGRYSATAYVDSDGIVNEALNVVVDLEVKGSEITFDFSRSSAPCKGPLNSVWATTQSAVYIAVKHIFPEVPINAGCFRPLDVIEPRGTFLFAEYPRPVAGCAAEVSQRVVEAIFLALGQAIPDRLFGCPAGTSGNLSIGGFDPRSGRHYIMYLFSGGGYGGWGKGDGLTNGCAAISNSKTQPIEVLEKAYPVIFEKYLLRTGSAGKGKYRGGFGVEYKLRLTRGNAIGSFLMDHGRSGPPGMLGGEAGAPNEIWFSTGGSVTQPEHLSKGEGYAFTEGDWVEVRTPGGGGYGAPSDRDPAHLEFDREREYFARA